MDYEMSSKKSERVSYDILSSIHGTSRITKALMIIFYGVLVLYLASTSAGVSAAPDVEEYKGPVYCSTCHEEEYEFWNQTAHANSFYDPAFQEQWKSQGSPGVCLKCHTTGFEMETGNFTFAQVTCESCHGPGGEMNLNTSVEFCSVCHSYEHFPTYEEWLESEHSHAGVECVTCHDPMSLNLITENPNQLCGGCHANITIEVKEGTHGAEGLGCVDCHMAKSLADFEGDEESITGHTFMPRVPSPDCGSCHNVTLEAHDVWGTNSENCLTCHDAVYMTMLHLLNGTDLAMSESSILCKQCHNDAYYEWKRGIHADPHIDNKTCIDCHSPMHPYIMMNATLPPIPQVARPAAIGPPIPTVFFYGAIAVVSLWVIYTFLGKKIGGI